MRQHKYKAIRTDGGGWVEGNYVQVASEYTIIPENSSVGFVDGADGESIDYHGWHEIQKETLCEFVVYHSRKAKGTEPAIEFDIYTGDMLYVAGIGEMVCMFDERELVYDFTNIESGVSWSYQDAMEDIERFVKNVHDEEAR
jgi:hypothetical protein